ncbi:peptidoglycan-binding protein [Nostoc flagelliforme FACHB-838]|uniref:Peptidoglycan-binding protein n=1 Tax=Nostoc flagelliforme FACHB-838 TaxID=2692904 RepID=A0ABR8DGH8_9NOSO|nr:peptidoglycan-binding protein [Nostoc flagelliforme FACHB-838]
MKTGVDSYLTKLASVCETSESIKVVPTVADFKFLNWKKLSSGTAMRLLSLALITGLLSIAGQALALQKVGSNGPEVSRNQRCLKKLGYFNGPVTGKFASLTQNAVIKFQQANRINADGVVGASTQRALQRTCQGITSNSTGALRGRTSPQASPVGQYPTLSQGKTGAAVTRLQQRLRQLGYFDTNPTGNFGRITKDAVIAFQRNYRIPATGIVNRQTWNALMGSSPTSVSSRLSTQQVRELQVRLRQLGYLNADATGNIGPMTREAVMAFQRNYGLPVDGIANAQVLDSVRRASTGGTQQSGRDYLTVGDQGENVRLVQERLWQLGFSNTNPDGFFNDYTTQSVIAFQQSSRLNSTGNVDRQTWEALGLNSSTGGNYIENTRYVLPPTNDDVVPVPNGNTLVANNPYRVIIPISNNDTLSRVQQYIPNAITEQSNLGDYVNAGAFSDRAQAETLTKKLRSLGLDARVKFN